MESRACLAIKFESISLDRVDRVKEQRCKIITIALFWLDIIGTICPLAQDTNTKWMSIIQDLGDEELQVLVADKSK